MRKYFAARAHSFRHAFCGLAVLLRTQPNDRLLRAASVIVSAGKG